MFKLSRKYYENWKKNSSILNICWNFEKKLSFLRKFYVNFGGVQNN